MTPAPAVVDSGPVFVTICAFFNLATCYAVLTAGVGLWQPWRRSGAAENHHLMTFDPKNKERTDVLYFTHLFCCGRCSAHFRFQAHQSNVACHCCISLACFWHLGRLFKRFQGRPQRWPAQRCLCKIVHQSRLAMLSPVTAQARLPEGAYYFVSLP